MPFVKQWHAANTKSRHQAFFGEISAMTFPKPLTQVLLSALLFTLLFYRSLPGLNLLIFELATIITLVLTGHFKLNQNSLIALAGTVVTTSAFVLYNSSWAFMVNMIAILLMVGVSIDPDAKSLLTNVRLGLENIFFGPIEFFRKLGGVKLGKRPVFGLIVRYYYLILPVFIIGVFMFLYRNSNPIFDGYMANAFGFIGDAFRGLFRHIDGILISLLILGAIISSFLFVQFKSPQVIKADRESQDQLVRHRSNDRLIRNMLGLKNEWRAGVFLLIALNLLLFFVNTIDVYWVWFNFEWDGNYLKQFVHEGTYLLILSILISVAIVLYFFRRNQNFYAKSGLLRILCYAWLAQNVILTISVGIRNLHYIEYFALAYKRIAVMFFLALVIVGIITVFLKVKQRKTAFYLFRVNAMAVFIVLVTSTAINWDMIIARYNFSHAHESYLHFDFVARLSPAAFPILDKSLEELQEIEAYQLATFPEEPEYMNAESYHYRINERMKAFAHSEQKDNWKEWNWADQRAMNYLREAHPEYFEESPKMEEEES